jgi:hypothetical protein
MKLGVDVPEATALLGVGSDEVATVTPLEPVVALPIVKPEGRGGDEGWQMNLEEQEQKHSPSLHMTLNTMQGPAKKTATTATCGHQTMQMHARGRTGQCDGEGDGGS